MTKSELIKQLYKRLRPHSANDVEIAVNKILDHLSTTLAKGGRAEIRGFGTFGVRARQPRLGRNPKTGERVEVPSKSVPFFKPGMDMRERVKTKVA